MKLCRTEPAAATIMNSPTGVHRRAWTRDIAHTWRSAAQGWKWTIRMWLLGARSRTPAVPAGAGWFCHLLADEACYEHDDSEIIQVGTDPAAFFPAGRSGICRVTETVKKAYMIRW